MPCLALACGVAPYVQSRMQPGRSRLRAAVARRSGGGLNCGIRCHLGFNTDRMRTSPASAGEDHPRIQIQQDGTVAVVSLGPAPELVRMVREPESGTAMVEDTG
ncbi:hypothetical protein NDU88_000606 [Pleurodeles waltl]|uniref:Uncharacterized protein n=1 Tax=Pleurodeles waltl TaxID=8319 RepID=A0AAV7UQG2_PLEWA|nr:hypothetical protein NDU88_000606 [Pleurodeles waltl]